MWFSTSSRSEMILKKSSCCSSVNRQRKILIRFEYQYERVSNGCTYANEIANEFVWLWYFESTYESIYKRILGQSYWTSEKALSFIKTKWQNHNDSQYEYSDDWQSHEFLNIFEWVENDWLLWQSCWCLIYFSDFFQQNQDEKILKARNCKNDLSKRWQDDCCRSSLHDDWSEQICHESSDWLQQSYEWLFSVNYIQLFDIYIHYFFFLKFLF